MTMMSHYTGTANASAVRQIRHCQRQWRVPACASGRSRRHTHVSGLPPHAAAQSSGWRAGMQLAAQLDYYPSIPLTPCIAHTCNQRAVASLIHAAHIYRWRTAAAG